MRETLQEIGLTEKEALLYLACLEHRPLNASRISELTSIQRTDCFAIAKKMVGKGLLIEERLKRSVLFKAVAPKKIFSAYEKRLENMREALPSLEALTQSVEKGRPTIAYYTGASGLEQISREASFSGGELLVFTAKEFITKDNGLYQKKHVAERTQHHTTCRTIVGMSSEALSHKEEDSGAKRETRVIPLDLFDAQTTVGIYKKRVFVMDYKKHFGFIVDDEHFANTLAQLFELTWNSGHAVT